MWLLLAPSPVRWVCGGCRHRRPAAGEGLRAPRPRFPSHGSLPWDHQVLVQVGLDPALYRLALSASFSPTLGLCSVKSTNEHSSPPPASVPMASERLSQGLAVQSLTVRKAPADKGSMQRNGKDRGGLLCPGACALSGLLGVHSQKTCPSLPRAVPGEGWVLSPEGSRANQCRAPCSLVLVDFVCHASKAKQTVGPCCHFPAPGMRGRLCSVVGYNWFCCGEPPLSTHPKSQWFTARAVYTSAALQSEWEAGTDCTEPS